VTIQFYKIGDGPPPIPGGSRSVYQAEIDEAFADDPVGKARAQAALDGNNEPLVWRLIAEAWDLAQEPSAIMTGID
jgi:hypothetical protein